jgi:hypothetical protein
VLDPVAAGALLAVVAAVAALSAWEGGLSRDQSSAHWSVVACAAGAVALAVLAGHGRQRMTSGQWLAQAWRSGTDPAQRRTTYGRGIAVWVILVVAVLVWDLTSFAAQVHDLPTLSYFAGHVTRHHWGRSLVFVAWLALGAYFALGWRTAGRARRPGGR